MSEVKKPTDVEKKPSILKVLNLYAGIGGNRKLWKSVKVTAVEIVPKIAEIYKNNFPEDSVIVGDAHEYLLDHYKEFDFIWSSPPCPTHSITNYFLNPQGLVRYPDMSLYQEILFLKHWFKGKWVVENVKPYYEPLVRAQVIGRHCCWANFNIPLFKMPNDDVGTMNRQAAIHKQQSAGRKNQEDRNAVYSPLGLHIFKAAFNHRGLDSYVK